MGLFQVPTEGPSIYMPAQTKLLPLSDDQLRTLGELVALHGFIEHELVKSVIFINVAHGNTGDQDVIKHKSLSADAQAWERYAREKLIQQNLLPVVSSIVTRLVQNIRDRNDFVHAVFQEKLGDGYPTGPYDIGSFGPPVAVRQGRKQEAKQLHDLPIVCNMARQIANELVSLNRAIILPHLPPRH
jgi:hypothetical protein